MPNEIQRWTFSGDIVNAVQNSYLLDLGGATSGYYNLNVNEGTTLDISDFSSSYNMMLNIQSALDSLLGADQATVVEEIGGWSYTVTFALALHDVVFSVQTDATDAGLVSITLVTSYIEPSTSTLTWGDNTYQFVFGVSDFYSLSSLLFDDLVTVTTPAADTWDFEFTGAPNSDQPLATASVDNFAGTSQIVAFQEGGNPFYSTDWNWTFDYTPTSGTYKIIIGEGDAITDAINFDADASTITSAIEALIGLGEVTVTNPASNSYDVVFTTPRPAPIFVTYNLFHGASVPFQNQNLYMDLSFDAMGGFDCSGNDRGLTLVGSPSYDSSSIFSSIANNNYNFLRLPNGTYGSAYNGFSSTGSFPMSISFYRLFTAGESGKNILTFGNNGGGGVHTYMFIRTVSGVLRVSDGDADASYADVWAVENGWHLITLVFPTGNVADLICYVNGIPQTQIANSGVLSGFTFQSGVGFYLYGSSDPFDSYDNIRLWENYALSAEEAADQVNNQQRVTIIPSLVGMSTTYDDTGSGGVVASGTGTVKLTTSKNGTGGAIVSGTATSSISASLITGTGGMVASGTGTVKITTSKNGTGGVLVSGTADNSSGIFGSGGGRVSGVALNKMIFNPTPTGGVKARGSVGISIKYAKKVVPFICTQLGKKNSNGTKYWELVYPETSKFNQRKSEPAYLPAITRCVQEI